MIDISCVHCKKDIDFWREPYKAIPRQSMTPLLIHAGLEPPLNCCAAVLQHLVAGSTSSFADEVDGYPPYQPCVFCGRMLRLKYDKHKTIRSQAGFTVFCDDEEHNCAQKFRTEKGPK